KNLSYGIGISYNNDLDKNAITPLGYLKYQHPKFRIYSILPSFAYFLFTPSEKFEYGLSYNLDSGIFHIDNLNSDTKNYLKTSNLTIAPTIGYNFYNQFWFNAKAGYAMFRRYHLLDADFEELPGMEKNKIDDGFFAMFGVSLRMNEK